MYSKIFTRLFVLIGMIGAFAAPALAQETLTVCDGTAPGTTTTTNSYIPIYGSYVDTQGATSEFIIPATTSRMDEMEGGTITNLSFYITNSPATWGEPVIQVYMGEVEGTTISGISGPTSFTVVYEGVISNTQATMEIELEDPFTYEGGNLLIGTYVKTKSSTYKYTSFSGISAPSGSSRYRSSGTGFGTAQSFLPQTTFTYTPAGGVSCAKPKSLNAVDITAHTATLTWTAGAEGQSNWDVYVTTDATDVPDDETEPTYQVTECTKALSGLTGETTYYAYVRSVCGGSDGNSTWAKKVFTTTVACPQPTLSYVANSNTAHTGTVSWTGNADNYELIYSTKYSFEPGDEGVVQVNLGSVNTYTLQDLTPETTYRIKVRANCGAVDGYSQWSNQVSFTTTATCVAPSSLSATATSNTITLSWTAGATDQDAWDIRYKTDSDDYTYIHIDNQTETSYTIPNLSPATTYSVNVRAYCDTEDQSKWGYSAYNQNSDLTVTTECAAVTLPYTCDFEGAVETSGNFSSYPVPKCWDRIEYKYGNYSPYSYYPYVYSYSSYAHSGTKSLRMYKTPNSANETIILPEIDEAFVMSNLQIRFWAMAGSSNNTLSVGIMENNVFTEVQLVEGVSTTYDEYTVELAEYIGNGRNIAIKCGSTTGYSYIYYYIDDVTVEVTPSCRLPKDLNAIVDSDSQATLTWTAGKDETAWNVQYKKATDNNWSEPIAVDETTYMLTGLKRAMVYEARVQAVCSTDDQSDWTDAISFQTDCGTLPIDAQHGLFEDFENVEASDFPPTCWSKFKYDMSGYSYWYLNSNNGLGSSAAFSYWSSGYAFLVMPKMHIDGNATLKFDYLIGSGDYDESCSVVVSLGGMTYNDFTQTLWAATGSNSGNASAIVSLANLDGEDVYIAFKFKGSGTSGCTWYVDNIQVYVNEPVNKPITAYSGDDDHYCLIASPIGTVSPEDVTNMLENSYDLYKFDQTQKLEWRNYEASPFNLEAGKGYLYANSGNVTLRFMGTPYNGNGQVTLTKTAGAEFEGWNLIGNPFNGIAMLGVPYYRLNEAGNALNATTETTAVAAMEGVFVQAASDGQTVTFATIGTHGNEPAVVPQTNIMVADEGGLVLDNAIIRFDQGQALEKFSFRQGSTKLYIPQDGKNYAIIMADAQGELPLNFKAEKNGTYTLSFSENVIASEVKQSRYTYLHLMDNLTGTDVDLLSPASYTFSAKKTDYESRFRLVFSTVEDGPSTPSTGSRTFAFISDGNIIVNDGPSTGSGTSILQVVDVMGRIMMQEESPTSVSTSGMTPGVYVLRLINGDIVRIQKIVVNN